MIYAGDMLTIKTMKHVLIGTAIAVCFFAMSVSVTHAAVYQQTNAATKNDAFARHFTTYTGSTEVCAGSGTGAMMYQPLGTGLVGVPSSLQITLSEDAGFAGSVSACLFEMSSNATSSYTGNYVRWSYNFPSLYAKQATTSSTGSYGGSWSSSTALDPTKYYALTFASGASQVGRLWGASSALNGYQCNWTGGSSGSCVGSPYYVLTTINTYSQQGIVDIVRPLQYTTTATASNVNFSFTYWVDTSQGFYDIVGFTLDDVTIGQSLDTTGATSSIIASGLSTYSGYMDLISGHTYKWKPYMSDSTGVKTRIYGQSSLFYVVTNTTHSNAPLVPYTNPFATTSWTGTNNFATSTGGTATSTGVISLIASSTCMAGIMYAQKDVTLNTKFPFSYICDFRQVLVELSQGDGSTQGDLYYALPMNTTYAGSSSVKIVDKSAIAQMTVVVKAKELLANAIYLMTGFGVVSLVMRML